MNFQATTSASRRRNRLKRQNSIKNSKTSTLPLKTNVLKINSTKQTSLPPKNNNNNLSTIDNTNLKEELGLNKVN